MIWQLTDRMGIKKKEKVTAEKAKPKPKKKVIFLKNR
jgi:hypothetical protein